MGMPNIPDEILAEMHIDKEDVMNILYQALKENKESFHKFFKSEKDFFRMNKEVPPHKEKEKINKGFCDINESLYKKNKDIHEKMNTIHHHYHKGSNKQFYEVYPIFLILVISLCIIRYYK